MTAASFHDARLRNRLHTLLLLGAMTALLAALGWSLAGAAGVAYAAALGATGMMLGARASARLFLRLHNARILPPDHAGGLYAIIAELAERAGLPAVPVLYYIPSPALQAISTNLPRGAAIAVTDGLLRNMSAREIAAVLAHEISHIASRDIRIMTLADLAARITRSLAFVGWLLVIVNVPLALAGQGAISWFALMLLIAGPTISGLMQLGLSRTREYDADLGAVRLSGDPEALASALTRLENYQGRFWEQMFLPGYRLPEPSLLRTHPDTDERVRRILQFPAGTPLRSLADGSGHQAPAGPVRAHAARWRPWGVWH